MRAVLCCACLTILEADPASWHEAALVHVLDDPARHPMQVLTVRDIQATFEAIITRSFGRLAGKRAARR